jgi:hypothetical protein
MSGGEKRFRKAVIIGAIPFIYIGLLILVILCLPLWLSYYPGFRWLSRYVPCP